MNVTREIVKDLLPLVVAGEASADSRDAVERWLADDPELARLAASLRAAEDAPPPPPGAVDAGRAALERTRRLVRRRSWLLGASIFLTALPLSCAFDDSGLRFLFIRDLPLAGALSLAAAAATWIGYAVVAGRLRVTGL